MTRNQLPEGVGKKIVEALKRQAEADITPVASIDNSFSANVPLQEQKNSTDVEYDVLQESDTQVNSNVQAINDNYIVEEENVNIPETFDVPKIKEEKYNNSPVKENSHEEIFNIQNTIPKVKEESYTLPARDSFVQETQIREPVFKEVPKQETPIFKTGSETTNVTFTQPHIAPVIPQYSGIPLSEEPKKNSMPSTVSISIPTNVAVLKNLIASLPVGVTKQTGAQIIRQTLEAMGLPMASVLKEAQEVQEELNTNTRECMLKIQEYKTNIMQLEQSVQEYQRNITQINDLVSLFLLTDRK